MLVKRFTFFLVMTFLNTYEFSSLDTNVHLADNHSIRVLTRSKSKAEQIFPGKKVMTTLLLFY